MGYRGIELTIFEICMLQISIKADGDSMVYFSCYLNSHDWIDFIHAFQNNLTLGWEQAQKFSAWQDLSEKVMSNWKRGGLCGS